MVTTTDELDELDLQLLDALQSNARSTFAELGSLVGLKAPAVHDRVKRLEQRGYIRATRRNSTRSDSACCSPRSSALYTTPDCNYDEFTRTLGDMPEVCEMH